MLRMSIKVDSGNNFLIRLPTYYQYCPSIARHHYDVGDVQHLRLLLLQQLPCYPHYLHLYHVGRGLATADDSDVTVAHQDVGAGDDEPLHLLLGATGAVIQIPVVVDAGAVIRIQELDHELRRHH